MTRRRRSPMWTEKQKTGPDLSLCGERPGSAGPKGLLLDPADSVVTVTERVPAGGLVCCALPEGFSALRANGEIPKYHKLAVRDIPKGGAVIRCGEVIGRATEEIRRGDWVHTHNLSDLPEEGEG